MLRKVYLEITNVCNLACAFCPGTGRAPRFLSGSEFHTLAGKLRGHTEYLYFHLMGEPLLHPELAELLRIAGSMGYKVMITTNGTLLDRAGETLLRSPAVHKVNVSLQSFEGNRGEDPATYIASCAGFAKRAAEAGKFCELRLWNGGGLDSRNGEIQTLLAAVFPPPWPNSRNGLKLRERVWLEPGDRFDWPDLAAEDRGGRRFCYGLRDQVGVLVDGTVVPCCLDHEGDMALGNLFESDLEDLLAGDRARAIREGFSRRQAVEPLCRRCGYSLRFT